MLDAQRHHIMPAPTRGLLGTWRQILPILRRQQREPGYQFVPELP